MDEKRNYFAFYETFDNQLEHLDDSTQLKFYRAIKDYGLYNIEPEFSGIELALWQGMKEAIDNQKARSAKNTENIKKRFSKNESQNDTTSYEPIRTDTNEYESIRLDTTSYEPIRTGDEREIEKEYEKEKESENERESIAAKPPFSQKSEKNQRFKKPTVQEISEYCQERQNAIDAQRFFDFYESKGWKVGNQPMKDWKAAVRNWEARQKQAPPAVWYSREKDKENRAEQAIKQAEAYIASEYGG